MEDENNLLPGEEWKPSSLTESFEYGSWPKPIAAGVSLESLIAKHQKYTDAWTSSSGYSACRELLTNTVLKQANIHITQCMCLCLSSLSTQAYECDKDYSRPMSQLVAFEGWVDLLKTKHNITKIVFQDPAFNALDKEFLSSRGYTVVDTPESDSYMSETTFLFSHWGMWNVLLASISVAFPALYIGSNLTGYFDFHCPPHYDYKTFDEDLHAMLLLAAKPRERAFLRRFLSQRVTRHTPPSDLAKWLLEGPPAIIYAPDNKDEILPVEFECKDEELFTLEQAEAEWKKRGLKSEDLTSISQ